MEPTIARFDEQSPAGMDGLVAEVSSTLIGVAPDDFPAAIEGALRRIGEALEVDLATFLQLPTADDATEAAFHWLRTMPRAVDIAADMKPLNTLLRALGGRGKPTILERIPEQVSIEGLPRPALDYLHRIAMKSAVVIPVTIPEQFTGTFAVGVFSGYRVWSERHVEWLRLLAEILIAAWHRNAQELELSQRRAEIVRLSAQLGGETRLPRPVVGHWRVEEIVGDSPALRIAVSRLLEVASSDSTVLLLGETGTGKELFAKVLHARSPRHAFPLVSVNSAALPPTLIESELFGHERGAFTGAVAQRQGRFEVAHRGTLFLDEIGDLPLDLQAKLLRVLQEGEFERLGTSRMRKVDVRIVAATHRDLKEAVAAGEFRDDLYYRLNVFPIRLPPLRERRDDIPALVWFLIQKRQRAMHRSIKTIPASVMEQLQRHSWPGNIRELENVIERALIHSTGDMLILLDDDLELAAVNTGDSATLSSIERAHIQQVLRACGWRINGSGNAAERLGLHPNTLRFRMKKLGIVRERLPRTH
jgi:transcriptional regulator with GAF, ATPase, and Fis domain